MDKCIKDGLGLGYIRFKLESTYSCYLCEWQGSDEEIGREHKVDDKGRDYDSLYCPNCTNRLLNTKYQKVYYG